jgi:acyl-coenzyme A thioesterase PaaI-like protein
MTLADLALRRPTISSLWATTARLPLGNRVFSKLVGRMAPYTGTIDPLVLELGDGRCRAQLRDRPAVRNHLRSVHAIALLNLGEVTTGLAVMHAVDGRGRGIVTGLSMEYLKKARGTITARCDQAVPLTPGKHDIEVAGELTDAQGEVVARVRATWRLDIG